MTTATEFITTSMPGERSRLLRLDALFWGALAILLLAALQVQLSRPFVEASAAQLPPGAAGVVEIMSWASLVLSPISFLVVTLFFASCLWAMGTLVEQPVGFRSLIAAVAWVEVLRSGFVVAALVTVRLDLLDPPWLMRMVGAAPQVLEGVDFPQALLGTALSPELLLWALALTLLLRRPMGWTLWPAAATGVVMLAVRSFFVALRQLQLSGWA